MNPDTAGFLFILGMAIVMLLGGLVFVLDTVRKERARARSATRR